jgi:hypothetical protein
MIQQIEDFKTKAEKLAEEEQRKVLDLLAGCII